jgi:hypothetical protein
MKLFNERRGIAAEERSLPEGGALPSGRVLFGSAGARSGISPGSWFYMRD